MTQLVFANELCACYTTAGNQFHPILMSLPPFLQVFRLHRTGFLKTTLRELEPATLNWAKKSVKEAYKGQSFTLGLSEQQFMVRMDVSTTKLYIYITDAKTGQEAATVGSSRKSWGKEKILDVLCAGVPYEISEMWVSRTAVFKAFCALRMGSGILDDSETQMYLLRIANALTWAWMLLVDQKELEAREEGYR